MALPLLERSAELAALKAAVGDLSAGSGSVVLVTGEAGIGETTLMNRYLDEVADAVRVFQGACDDLVAANPLGPLRDAATGTDGRPETALAQARMDVVTLLLVLAAS